MRKTCPSCGTETFPGARFCRRCGAPVRDEAEGTGDVSPQAATVPLDAGDPEGRATEGLAPADGRGSAQTSRVSLAEMERLLRAQSEAEPPKPPEPTDSEVTHVRRTPPAPPHPSAVTRPDAPAADFDEELTITVPRPPLTRETGDFETTSDLEATRPADFESTRPADLEATRPSSFDPKRTAAATRAQSQHEERDVPAPEEEAQGITPRGEASSHAHGATPPARPPAAVRRRAWPAIVAVCVGVLVLAGGGWLAYKLLRRPDVTEVPTQGPAAPPVTSDARQQFEQKLAEAEAMLAAGNMDGAVARLREATGLDPANPRAHRRLAELLLSTGARREAIEELRAVVRAEPEDAGAWRQLASAQLAEGLYRDAAESYRRLVALAGQQSADPADLLSYADALRLSGRAEEARSLYERLTAASPSDVAAAARQHLSELAVAQPSATPAHQAGEQPTPQPGEGVAVAAVTPSPTAPAEPAATPTPQPTPQPPAPAQAQPSSPAEHYGRGQQLWSSNRAAALDQFRAAAARGNYDAHYYLGLSYVEGRRLGSLKRAEVVAALQHFQLAQRGRQYAAESRRYEQQLEKEFDRLRRQ